MEAIANSSGAAVFDAPAHRGARLRGWGVGVSIAAHIGALAALVALTREPAPAPPQPRVIRLTLAAPLKPAPPLSPVKPAAAVPRPANTPREVARPVRAKPVLRERVEPAVPALARQAQPPQQTAQAPAADAPAAPANDTPSQAARPSVVDMSGIPSNYVSEVYARINAQAADHYPRLARIRHLQGRVIYKLTLDANGRLLGCELQSSGEALLDRAAGEAVHAAAPFPKLPDLGATAYVLTGVIAYTISD